MFDWQTISIGTGWDLSINTRFDFKQFCRDPITLDDKIVFGNRKKFIGDSSVNAWKGFIKPIRKIRGARVASGIPKLSKYLYLYKQTKKLSKLQQKSVIFYLFYIYFYFGTKNFSEKTNQQSKLYRIY